LTLPRTCTYCSETVRAYHVLRTERIEGGGTEELEIWHDSFSELDSSTMTSQEFADTFGCYPERWLEVGHRDDTAKTHDAEQSPD